MNRSIFYHLFKLQLFCCGPICEALFYDQLILSTFLHSVHSYTVEQGDKLVSNLTSSCKEYEVIADHPLVGSVNTFAGYIV